MDAITQENDATAGQMKLIHRFIGDAVGRTVGACVLTKREAQCIIERGDELAAAVRGSVASILKDLAVFEKYAHEHVSSRHVYNTRYSPKSLPEQCQELTLHFPTLKTGVLHETPLPLPPMAESWFAIPRWQSIAPTYQEAVDAVLERISRRFKRLSNQGPGKLQVGHVRQSAPKLAALDKALVGGDIRLIPAQFGIRHRGCSARRMREALLPNEFPLGIFEVAVMILTHPERLMHVDDLWVTCAGDEYDCGELGKVFHLCPYFYCAQGPLEVGTQWVGDVRERVGVPSGFLCS